MGYNPLGMINSFLNPGDAYKDAGNQANQAWNQMQQYEKPFWQNGMDQYGRLNQATGDLMDPASLQNKWAGGYEQSPYAKQLLQQNQASGLDAASSMGLNGSSAAIGNIQQGAGNIVSKDRQQYMDDLMQKYMTGIGLGKDIYNTGANMGGLLGGQSQQHGDTMAGLKYGESSAPGQLLGQLIGAGMGAAGGYMMPGGNLGSAFSGATQGGGMFGGGNRRGYSG